MKVRHLIAAVAVCVAAAGGTSHAAVTDRFTATSTSAGVLGYLDLDSAFLDGSANQFINNSDLTDIFFTNPSNGYTITTIGPTGQGTFFDSSAAQPTVVGGSGFTGGTGEFDGVYIADTNFVQLGTGTSATSYDDVAWTTTAVMVSDSVPEPVTILLFGAGLAGTAAVRRRNKRQA